MFLRAYFINLKRRITRRLFPDRRTTAQVIADMRRKEIQSLLDGSAMETLSLQQQPVQSSQAVIDKLLAPTTSSAARHITRTVKRKRRRHRPKARGHAPVGIMMNDGFTSSLYEIPEHPVPMPETAQAIPTMTRSNLNDGEGDSEMLPLTPTAPVFMDDTTISVCDAGINPANGLPMVAGSCVDIEGNPYGTDFHHDTVMGFSND